jgi:hypothetical protein
VDCVRIGIDFDNTIAGLDAVFVQTAKHMGLVDFGFYGHKRKLRDTIRCLPDGEVKWQRLQGRVYGAGMASAELFDGAGTFLRHCRIGGQKVSIVSHKTEYGHYDHERVNLRKAALDWMTTQGFFSADGLGIRPEDVYFEATREDKLKRIGSLECEVFIDDLEEVLIDPDFPKGVQRVLFSETADGVSPEILHCRTWHEILQALFNGVD